MVRYLRVAFPALLFFLLKISAAKAKIVVKDEVSEFTYGNFQNFVNINCQLRRLLFETIIKSLEYPIRIFNIPYLFS